MSLLGPQPLGPAASGPLSPEPRAFSSPKNCAVVLSTLPSSSGIPFAMGAQESKIVIDTLSKAHSEARMQGKERIEVEMKGPVRYSL